MKTKLFALILLVITVCISCEKDEESDEFCNNPQATCPDDTELDVTACCTDQGCYWTYNGKDYDCSDTGGDACKSARAQILDIACANSSAANLKSTQQSFAELNARLKAVTDKLLIEARACAACN